MEPLAVEECRRTGDAGETDAMGPERYQRLLPEVEQERENGAHRGCRAWLLFHLLSLSGPGEWTTWFNIDHPGGQGDYERLDAIHFYYGDRVCARPLRLEARTTDWMPAGSTGQVVHGSPREGFWCLNREQRPGQNCSNYTVRFLCPAGEPEWPHSLPPTGLSTGKGQGLPLATGTLDTTYTHMLTP